MIALADAGPDAPTAPRAYLAAAVAYVEWTGADTLALARPMPDSLVSPVLLAAANEAARASSPASPPAPRDGAAAPPPEDETPVRPEDPAVDDAPATPPQRTLEDEGELAAPGAPAKDAPERLADDDAALLRRRAARPVARAGRSPRPSLWRVPS